MEKIEKILNKIMKTILNAIFVILLIIVGILTYNIIQLSVFNKPYMNLFGYTVFEVRSGSMSGTLEIDDIIVVKLTKDIKEGDIITFISDNAIITHRVYQIQDEAIITKGDANNIQDEPISKDNVVGKVVLAFENIAIWKQVIKEPQVYILVIITLILFGISISIQEKKKE